MKKYFLIALILAFTVQINAQNNLVFNSAILLELTSSGTTVPEGKVWKVQDGSGGYSYLVNGEIWTVGGSGSYKSTPTWFPEGSVFTRYTGPNRLSFLSILEFNVVPLSADTGSSSGVTSIDDFNTEGAGTSYGDDYTPGESVTDYDGNVYETVTIGPQTWTTSNLNVSTYRDGTPIPHITDFNQWKNATTGAYTYINQNESEARGKVYNVWAVIGRNDEDPNTPLKELAPDGFRIPSKNDWVSLINFFGGFGSNSSNGVANASDYLKSETGWYVYTNGNNESGLNIYPNGRIYGSTTDVVGSCFSNCSDVDLFSLINFFTSTRQGFGSSVTFTTIGFESNSISPGTVSSTSGVYNDGTIYTNANGGAHIRLIKN